MALIFISHSSKDKERMQKYIKQIEEYFNSKPFFLDVDDEVGLKESEEWEPRLYNELSKCSIALFFITKNWIDSCWCQKEYSLARTLGKEIFYTNIEDDKEKKDEVFRWIGEHIQQSDITNEKTFKKLLKEIEKVSDELLEKPYPWNPKDNPYPGLVAFDKKKAAVFFGREKEIDEIVDKFSYELFSTKAFLILGASGMGKSSLLKAGSCQSLRLENIKRSGKLLKE